MWSLGATRCSPRGWKVRALSKTAWKRTSRLPYMVRSHHFVGNPMLPWGGPRSPTPQSIRMIYGILDIRMIVQVHLIDPPQVKPASRDAMDEKPSWRAEWTFARKKCDFLMPPHCLLVAGGGDRPEGHLGHAKGELAPLPCLAMAIASVCRFSLIWCS